jgi:hypothetical protein
MSIPDCLQNCRRRAVSGTLLCAALPVSLRGCPMAGRSRTQTCVQNLDAQHLKDGSTSPRCTPIPTAAGQAELLDIKVDFFPFSVLNIFHACYTAPYQNCTEVTYVEPKPLFGAPSAAASFCRFSN